MTIFPVLVSPILILQINQIQRAYHKKEISQTRYENFIRNKAINFRNKEPVIEDQHKHSIKRNERYIGKGENITNDFTFSGTDNGLVTLSETILFSLDRFNYHLVSYNTYTPLAEDTQDDHELINNLQSIPFHSLGYSFKVNSDDFDLGSGYRRQRKKLERDKKNKQSGHVVMEAEQRLAGISKNTTTIEQVVAIHQEKRTCKKVFRDFYYSNKQVSITKSVMFLDKRYRDKICSQERRYASCTASIVGGKEICKECRGAFQCINSSCISVTRFQRWLLDYLAWPSCVSERHFPYLRPSASVNSLLILTTLIHRHPSVSKARLEHVGMQHKGYFGISFERVWLFSPRETKT